MSIRIQRFASFFILVGYVVYRTGSQIPTTQCGCQQIEQCMSAAQAQQAQITSACELTCAQSYFGGQGQTLAQCYSSYSQSKAQLAPQERQCFYQATQTCTGVAATNGTQPPTTTTALNAITGPFVDPVRQLVTLVPPFRQFTACVDACVNTNGTMMQLASTNTTSSRRRKRGLSGAENCASQNQCYLITGSGNTGMQLANCLAQFSPQIVQLEQTKCSCIANALNLGSQVSCTSSQQQQQQYQQPPLSQQQQQQYQQQPPSSQQQQQQYQQQPLSSQQQQQQYQQQPTQQQPQAVQQAQVQTANTNNSCIQCKHSLAFLALLLALNILHNT